MRFRQVQVFICLPIFLAGCDSTAPIQRNVKAEWLSTSPTPIRMEVTTSKHVIARGKVNGTETPMLIDTGADVTVLDDAFAARLGIEPVGATRVSGVGGFEQGRVAVGVEVRIGDLVLRDVVALILDLGEIEERLGMEIPVILGRGLFEHAVVELDYPGGKLVCHPPRSFTYGGPGATTRLQTTPGGKKLVEGRIEDLAPAWFGLDTGSGHTLDVFERYTADNALLEGRTPQSKRVSGGVGGFEPEAVASLRAFTIAGFTLRDLPAAFPRPEQGAFASRVHAGNLGGGVLHRFRVLIDYGRGQMHLEPGPELEAPFPRDRLGVTTTVRDGALEIRYVSPGSPADRAGMRAGMKITHLSGGAVPPETLRTILQVLATSEPGGEASLRIADGREFRVELRDYF